METKVDKVLGLLREKDAGGGASGGVTSAQASSIAKQVALPKNSSWTTTVGGYTMTFDGSGGLAVTCAGEDNQTLAVSMTSGQVRLAAFDDLSGEGHVIGIGNGGIVLSGTELGETLSVNLGEITANGSAITQVSSSFDGTSLGIAELAGGVKYFCSSALSALSIGSAAPGCNATIFFTVASGAVVTLPGSLGSRFFGEYPNSAGVSYCLAINGDMAVCAPAVSAGV